MIQISERVYLVGSGKDGSEISHPKDCNVFLLDGGTEAVLIDAGSGLAAETIAANIARTGVPMERVKRVLLTHTITTPIAEWKLQFRQRRRHGWSKGIWKRRA